MSLVLCFCRSEQLGCKLRQISIFSDSLHFHQNAQYTQNTAKPLFCLWTSDSFIKWSVSVQLILYIHTYKQREICSNIWEQGGGLYFDWGEAELKIIGQLQWHAFHPDSSTLSFLYLQAFMISIRRTSTSWGSPPVIFAPQQIPAPCLILMTLTRNYSICVISAYNASSLLKWETYLSPFLWKKRNKYL